MDKSNAVRRDDRSRSPPRDRPQRTQHTAETAADGDSSYSASLRVASLETLTGKRDALQLNTTVNAEAGINPRKSGDDVHPQSSAAANPLSSLLSSLPAGSPFSQLFAMAAAGNNTDNAAAALPNPPT